MSGRHPCRTQWRGDAGHIVNLTCHGHPARHARRNLFRTSQLTDHQTKLLVEGAVVVGDHVVVADFTIEGAAVHRLHIIIPVMAIEFAIVHRHHVIATPTAKEVTAVHGGHIVGTVKTVKLATEHMIHIVVTVATAEGAAVHGAHVIVVWLTMVVLRVTMPANEKSILEFGDEVVPPSTPEAASIDGGHDVVVTHAVEHPTIDHASMVRIDAIVAGAAREAAPLQRPDEIIVTLLPLKLPVVR